MSDRAATAGRPQTAGAAPRTLQFNGDFRRVHQHGGTQGTVCIYQPVSEQALRDHAERVGVPADEITPVADTVIVRSVPGQEQNAA